MTPECGDALFSRFLGDNLMSGTNRLLSGVGLIVIVVAILIKLI
ncbi:MAG TPA: hypothetical protein VL574_04280 [Stellaceae bacterium]|nr:hypothetical protein [Stellaceae bacterium]